MLSLEKAKAVCSESCIPSQLPKDMKDSDKAHKSYAHDHNNPLHQRSS